MRSESPLAPQLPMNRRPQIELIAPDASPEEAAALAAALERFMRDTAPVLAPAPPPKLSAWHEAALNEGVRRQPQTSVPWE